MIIDLRSPDAPALLKTTVCIVGGGTAGSYLAHRLSRARIDVAVLEAGGEATSTGRDLGFAPLQAGVPYGGVHDGRAFGLGGTSALWGGLLIPHSDLDVAASTPELAGTWRHIVEVTEAHVATVRQVLGINRAPDHDTRYRSLLGPLADQLGREGLVSRVSEMLPFRSRNLARLLRADPASSSATTVIHAVARDWSISSGPDGARVDSVTAVTDSGRTVTCHAKHFVIACGAIESARVLHEVDRATGERALTGRGAIGRGLSDHLSVRMATPVPHDLPLVIRLFAPRFDGSVMRAPRWTLRTHGPRHFAHFAFAIQNPGFQLAKKTLFALQARTIPRLSVPEVIRGFGGLGRLAFDRLARQRLHVPMDTPVALQLDVEQDRREHNSVLLDQSLDQFGRPRASVRWSVSTGDEEHLLRLQKAMLGAWTSAGGAASRLQEVTLGTPEAKLHDAYHPVGTTLMGESSSAVVDSSTRVRGMCNLFALSTGIFPTAGGANPTLGLLCFAERLSSDIRDACR